MTETEQNINIMINKYQNGKVYTIRSHQTDLFYIGSTCNSLSKRFNGHKTNKDTTCKEIIKYDDAYIELLEFFPCNNKDELNKREGELIRFHKNKCVNIKLEGRSTKEYYENNKEKIKEIQKEYYKNNKEQIKERDKKYYENNKEKIYEIQREYYKNNEEKIKQLKKEYYNSKKNKKYLRI